MIPVGSPGQFLRLSSSNIPQWADLNTSNTVSDIDGNVYHTVIIGTQTWMVENLRTTKFNDGTSIPLASNDGEWGSLTTPGYCWAGYDEKTFKNTYGALYNWYTVNTGKLAPKGWHVPNETDWDILQIFLIANSYNWDLSSSENKIGKSMASKTLWQNSTKTGAVGNDIATNNKSGFSAIPGGECGYAGGFYSMGYVSYFWSATESSETFAHNCYLFYDNESFVRLEYLKNSGYSVRLVKD